MDDYLQYTGDALYVTSTLVEDSNEYLLDDEDSAGYYEVEVDVEATAPADDEYWVYGAYQYGFGTDAGDSSASTDATAAPDVTSDNISGEPTWTAGGSYSIAFYGTDLSGLTPTISGCSSGDYSISGWADNGTSITTTLTVASSILEAAGCTLSITAQGETILASLPATPAVCAVPVNFSEPTAGYVAPSNPFFLLFSYTWGSSTGNLPDLSACTVGETVAYSPASYPSPPFPSGIPVINPSGNTFSAAAGAGGDTWGLQGVTAADFVTPYSSQTVNQSQTFWYSCPCAYSGVPVSMAGPVGGSDSVYPISPYWVYQVQKANISPASISTPVTSSVITLP